MPQWRFDADKVAQIAAEYEAGATFMTLEWRYHTSRSTLRSVLNQAGVTIRSKRVPIYGMGEQRLICAAYQEGASLAQLADTWFVSSSTVLNYLIEAGIPRRTPGGANNKAKGGADAD